MSENLAVITIKSESAKGENFQILMDTGAECSLIKLLSLKGDVWVNKREKVRISGTCEGKYTTLGTTIINLQISEGMIKPAKFNVVGEEINIPGDGILGMDFISNRMILDGINNKIYFKGENDEEIVLVSNEFAKPKKLISEIAPWSRYSNDIAKKVLLNHGYNGQGLGVSNQGIQMPIEASVVMQNKEGLGLKVQIANQEQDIKVLNILANDEKINSEKEKTYEHINKINNIDDEIF